MNATGNEMAEIPPVRVPDGDVPRLLLNQAFKSICPEAARYPNPVELELQLGSAKVDESIDFSAPAVLKSTHELTVLHRNPEGPVLQCAGALHPILPDSRHAASFVGLLLGGAGGCTPDKKEPYHYPESCSQGQERSGAEAHEKR